jgi:hypothetical protein
MTIRFIIGAFCFCVAVGGLIYSNSLLYMMIGEVNRKRPDGKTISYFGFTVVKVFSIVDEYRRLYPHGKLHRYRRACLAVAYCCLAGVAICLMVRFR